MFSIFWIRTQMLMSGTAVRIQKILNMAHLQDYYKEI
jgi:hypothetical protein